VHSIPALPAGVHRKVETRKKTKQDKTESRQPQPPFGLVNTCSSWFLFAVAPSKKKEKKEKEVAVVMTIFWSNGLQMFSVVQ
jgi:hypothetical protein